MYLRPDEVARVLEKAGFTMDVVTQKAYGYRRGDNYVYVNREARMGRTALVIHPALKERSNIAEKRYRSFLFKFSLFTVTCVSFEQDLITCDFIFR